MSKIRPELVKKQSGDQDGGITGAYETENQGKQMGVMWRMSGRNSDVDRIANSEWYGLRKMRCQVNNKTTSGIRGRINKRLHRESPRRLSEPQMVYFVFPFQHFGTFTARGPS